LLDLNSISVKEMALVLQWNLQEKTVVWEDEKSGFMV
jgi:hypothetical protein